MRIEKAAAEAIHPRVRFGDLHEGDCIRMKEGDPLNIVCRGSKRIDPVTGHISTVALLDTPVIPVDAHIVEGTP